MQIATKKQQVVDGKLRETKNPTLHEYVEVGGKLLNVFCRNEGLYQRVHSVVTSVGIVVPRLFQ